MNRQELEHIIRAAGEIAGVREIVILGSQSVLGQFPRLSESLSQSNDSEMSTMIYSHDILLRSIEADVMIPGSEEKTEMVEAAIGELSSFHHTFGYYAQGVDQTTSTLPEGWEDRLVEICNENTHGIAGQCLEIHDLIISKLYAGREKDVEFFHAAVTLGLLSQETLLDRLLATPMPDERKGLVARRIEREFSR